MTVIYISCAHNKGSYTNSDIDSVGLRELDFDFFFQVADMMLILRAHFQW